MKDTAVNQNIYDVALALFFILHVEHHAFGRFWEWLGAIPKTSQKGSVSHCPYTPSLIRVCIVQVEQAEHHAQDKNPSQHSPGFYGKRWHATA